MTKFEAGKTYQGRFICDADSIILLTVVKRTAKTITTDEGKTLRIREWNGVETVMPFGRYSMAPTISADRPKAPAVILEHVGNVPAPKPSAIVYAFPSGRRLAA